MAAVETAAKVMALALAAVLAMVTRKAATLVEISLVIKLLALMSIITVAEAAMLVEVRSERVLSVLDHVLIE